jgi:hypothetical protein
MTDDPFFNQLTAGERQYGNFQQDNATAHTASAAMVAIREVFEDRIISRGLCPPRSPDLSFCDFYLWGNLMGKVRFEVLKAVSTKMAVFWVVAPCSLVEVYQRFRGPCYLHHQSDE